MKICKLMCAMSNKPKQKMHVSAIIVTPKSTKMKTRIIKRVEKSLLMEFSTDNYYSTDNYRN